MRTGISFDIFSRGCSVVHTASQDRIAEERGEHRFAAVRRTYRDPDGGGEELQFLSAHDTREEAADACLRAWAAEPRVAGNTIHLPESWRLSRIQRRAVAYGACDVAPTELSVGLMAWPADQDVVSILSLTYHEDDTFSGWGLGSVPEWTQH